MRQDNVRFLVLNLIKSPGAAEMMLIVFIPVAWAWRGCIWVMTLIFYNEG